MSEQTNPELVKKVLQRVKHHINNKEYDKARALLLRINHPKRDEWIKRLEASSRRQQVDKLPKPWDPNFWANMTIVATPFVTTFILAWNWRRFGKKGWVLPTMSVPVLFIASIIGLFFLMFQFGANIFVDSQYRELWIGALVVLGTANYTFPFVVAGRQKKALKLLEEKGRMAMLAHRYDLGRGVLMWLVYIGISSAIGIGMGWYNNQPNEFSDGWVAIEYPGNWSSYEVGSIPNCQEDFLDCHLFIHSQFGGTGFLLAELTPPPGVRTSSDVIDLVWNGLRAEERVERGPYTVNDIPGYYGTYINSADGQNAYLTDIVAIANNQILYISIISTNEEVMEDTWHKVEAILETLVWTP